MRNAKPARAVAGILPGSSKPHNESSEVWLLQRTQTAASVSAASKQTPRKMGFTSKQFLRKY